MSDHRLTLEQPYREADPLSMEDGREAARRAARMRRDAEAQLRDAVDARAEKEGSYRKRLAEEIAKATADYPATVAVDIARGQVYRELVEFRVAEGMVSAHTERLRTLEGERSMLKSLIEWSATIQNVLRESE